MERTLFLRRVRMAIALALIIPFSAVLLVTTLRAQVGGFSGRGSRPPAGFSGGNRPGFPGGGGGVIGNRPGFPGNSGNFRGGNRPGFPGSGSGIIGNRPGFPNNGNGMIGNKPGFPNNPGNIAGGNRPGFPNNGGGIAGGNRFDPLSNRRGIGGGLFEWIWTCSKCGRELGRSRNAADSPPNRNCPHCGVQFINGGIGGGGTFKPADGANNAAPGPFNPGGAPPAVNQPNNGGWNLPQNVAPSRRRTVNNDSSATILIIGALVFMGALAAVFVTIAVIVFLIIKNSKKPKRRRRREADYAYR